MKPYSIHHLQLADKTLLVSVLILPNHQCKLKNSTEGWWSERYITLVVLVTISSDCDITSAIDDHYENDATPKR